MNDGQETTPDASELTLPLNGSVHGPVHGTSKGEETPPWSRIKIVAADVANRASQMKETMFGHMFSSEAMASSANARRRAMMMIDVLVERHHEGPLKRRWLLVAFIATFCYWHYFLPAFAEWGSRHFERSVDASVFAETVGGSASRVNFGALVCVTLTYITLLLLSKWLMGTRMPVKRVIFETLAVYNFMQMLLNGYVFVQLLRHARLQGFQYPWGNKFLYTQDSHKLGYFIWLHYHCCQLELFDTLFVVIRKKNQKLTFLHIWLRLLNMWGWFFACRYACGGDTYFPAAVNAGTRAVVYAFYTLSMLSSSGVPFLRKARVTAVQMLQFGLCSLHALFCLCKFWNMDIPRILLVIYFVVMANGLFLYTDFHYQAVGKSEGRLEASRKVSFAFDSSGWFYCYHFGVAAFLRQHLLPDGLTPEGAEEKFPAGLAFSGSSGGALVASVLSMGMDPAEVFEMVLEKRSECKINPFRMLPAVEAVLDRMMPKNASEVATNRLSILLTRVSFQFPFFTAEVVNKFRTRQDLWHALRASCHVPIIGGLGPHCYDGHAYFDGMFWPQFLVPWKGTHDDFVVRVNVMLSGPASDIAPPLLPTWWSLFPPEESVLRGLYWIGYENAARWFAQAPHSNFGSFSCRRSAAEHAPSAEMTWPSKCENSGSAEDIREDRSSTWQAAQKLLLRSPSSKFLPDVDAATGRNPVELVQQCHAARERDRNRLVVFGSFLFAAISLLLVRIF
jgi:hypothetical protein